MAGGAIKGITIELDGNTTKLTRALEGANKSISGTQRGLKEVEKLLKMDPGNVDLLKQKQEMLGKSISATKEKLDTLRTASVQAAASNANYDAWAAKMEPIRQKTQETSEKLKALRDEAARAQQQLNRGEISPEQYDRIQQEITQTEQDLSALRAEARAVGKEFGNPVSDEQYEALQREIIATEQDLKQLETQARQSASVLGAQMQAAGQKIQAAGQKMSQAGSHLNTSLTLPLLALGGAAVKTTMDFDTSMSKVQALSGAVGADFDALRSKARELGASTRYSASEAADAMGELALAGWDTSEILEGTDGVLQLAASSGLELANAAGIVSGNLAAFGMEAKDAAKLSDILATAQAESKTTAQQMGEAWNNSATTLTRAGQKVETTTALLEGMASVNDVGSAAGTKLNAVMAQMTQKMEDGAIAIGDTTVAVMDADGNFRDLIDIIADVENATYGMGDAERAAALQTTFNRTSMQGLNELLAVGSDKLREYRTGLENSAGAAADMAAVMQDNLEGKITTLKSQTQELGIALGDILVPKAQKAVEIAQNLVTWLSGLDEGTQNLIVNAGLAAAAAGPVLTVGGKLVTGAGKLAEGAGMLTTKLGALGAEAGLVAPMVAAVSVALAAIIMDVDRLIHLGTDGDGIFGTYKDVEKYTREVEDCRAAFGEMGVDIDLATLNLQEAQIALHNATKRLDELRGSEEEQAKLLQQVRSGQVSVKDGADALGISEEALRRKIWNLEYQEIQEQKTARESAEAMLGLGDAADEAGEEIDEAAQAAEEAQKKFDELVEDLAGMPDVVRATGMELGDLANLLYATGTSADSFASSVENTRNSVVNAFNEISVNSEMTAAKMGENLSKNLETMQTWGSNLEQLWWQAYQNQDTAVLSYIAYLANQGPTYAGAVAEFANGGYEALKNQAEDFQTAGQLAVDFEVKGLNMQAYLASQAAQEGASQAAEAAGDTEGEFSAAAAGWMTAETSGVRSGQGSVSGAARVAALAAKNAAASVGGWQSVGLSMAQGLAAGISSGQYAAVNAARNMVQAAITAARAEAQVNSPSKLFRDKLGTAIPEGVAAGVEKNMGVLKTSMRDMVRTSVTTAGAEARDSAGISGGVGLRGGIGQVNLNIYASPGMDERALARHAINGLRRELAQQEAAHGA